MARIKIYPTAHGLARAAADRFTSLAREAIASRGQFFVALAGGSTPRRLYQLLTRDEFASNLDWTCIHIFFGDERHVPPDHPESNYRMVRETLLDHISIPEKNVHRIHGEIKPEQAAIEYEQTLVSFFASNQGSEISSVTFDLVLLGMGTDGHTASLFAGRSKTQERSCFVVSHFVDKLQSWRVTLTPFTINGASHVIFIVSGKEKAQKLKQVLEGPYKPDALPSQSIKPNRGFLMWLLDAEAASRLSVKKNNLQHHNNE